MATYTPNLNLKKPSTGEYYDVVADNNDAKDKIDLAVGNITQIKTLINNTMTSTEIQNILNNGTDFKFLAGEYNLDFQPIISQPTCLLIPSNVNIEMEKGVVLKVKPNDYGDTYERGYFMLRIYGKSNISIKGGTLVGDRSNHIGTVGEWGYGVQSFNSSNVILEDIISKDFWGDGFAIQDNSENVKLINCTSDNNRRQGLTIGHVKNLRVINSTFKNTNGTLPEAGIDVEPNNYGPLENIHFENVTLLNNAGAGLEFNFSKMLNNNVNTDYVSITSNNLFMNGNKNGINYTNTEHAQTGYLKGLITLNNTTILNSSTPIRYANIKKDIMPALEMNDTLIKKWSNYTWAINAFVNVSTVARYGGLSFNGLRLEEFNAIREQPSAAIKIETNSTTRPIDIVINDLSGDEPDYGEYVYWNYGEGSINFKDKLPFYSNSGVKRGIRSAEYLNGLTVTNSTGASFNLPGAAGLKNRIFVIAYNAAGFTVQATGADVISGDGIITGTGFIVRSGNRFVVKSNGTNWVIIEQTGTVKNSGALGSVLMYAKDSIPTSGTFKKGSFVFNLSPVIGSYVLGWHRLTDGSAHVINVDWKAITN